MQTEHTSANIELKPKRTTKDREEQRREKQRQESESKKVQRQRLMAAIAEAANAGRDRPKKRRSKLSKSPREGLPAQGVVPSEYLTTQQAAAYLNISRQYLEAARYRGDGSGPAYVKLERAVRYRRSVLDAWMSAHDHSPDKPIYTE
jgi:hypothetical protein